jgi:hypothetical protein
LKRSVIGNVVDFPLHVNVIVEVITSSGVRNLSRSQSADWATSWQPLR